MDFLQLLMLTSIFFFIFSLVGMIYLSWSNSRFVEKRNLRKRLLYMSAGGKLGQDKLSIYKKEALQKAGALERFAFALPRIPQLDRKLIKAGLPLNATTFIFGSLALGGLGFFVAYKLQPHTFVAVILGIFSLAAPYLLLSNAEKKSMDKFEEQIPEALDLLARAVRSGHAVSSGFEMVAQEMESPIKTEFAAMVDEINLGLSFHEALENMCTRVPSKDLRMFAISILVQKQTGGNIGEILDNIGGLIRERVKFRREVKTLTADGRISAVILISLPIVMAGYIYMVNYEYVSLLWTEKFGIYMIAGATIGMILGALVMKKIVTIDI
jgi:tight adherence protein B